MYDSPFLKRNNASEKTLEQHFFFFFLPRLQLEEFPGPGIKLMSQQGPEMLNLRCHKRTPGVTSLMFGKKKILYLVKMYFKN